jgi:hypothetical protein
MSGIPIRGGIATARDAACTHLARAAWGRAEAPWCVPDCGRVRPMDHGTLTWPSMAASTQATGAVARPSCEPVL